MKTKLKLLTVLLTILLTSCFVGWTASAYALLTGPINGIPETSYFTWGDGAHDLTEFWSTRSEYGGDGWFYGSNYSLNVDIYIYSGLTDPTTISDWTSFAYSKEPLVAYDGDTVFFRGTNGYYGAWRIDDIYPNDPPDIFPYTSLKGQWYFQDVSAVPLPGAVWLLGSGLLGLVGWRRLKKG